MLYDEIIHTVKKIRKQYGEDDPFRLCKEMKIILLPTPMGTGDGAIKGFFFRKCRISTITYNTDLSGTLQKIIVAHELGHARLHMKSRVHMFHDVALFDESSQYEKEANLFAAELLLDDETVLSTLNADNTFFSAAAALNVPIELLDFKFRIMKWKGYKVVEPPIIARNNFLKDIKTTGCDEFDN